MSRPDGIGRKGSEGLARGTVTCRNGLYHITGWRLYRNLSPPVVFYYSAGPDVTVTRPFSDTPYTAVLLPRRGHVCSASYRAIIAYNNKISIIISCATKTNEKRDYCVIAAPDPPFDIQRCGGMRGK